jgi:hypothetical protein
MDRQTLRDALKAQDAYNVRRWSAWLIGFCSIVFGSFLLADVAGALIGFGAFCVAVALSQEIRAAIHPIGLAAIETLGRPDVEGAVVVE